MNSKFNLRLEWIRFNILLLIIITYKKKQMVNNCNLLKYSTEKVNISISKQDIPFMLLFIVENIFSKFQKKQKKLQ